MGSSVHFSKSLNITGKLIATMPLECWTRACLWEESMRSAHFCQSKTFLEVVIETPPNARDPRGCHSHHISSLVSLLARMVIYFTQHTASARRRAESLRMLSNSPRGLYIFMSLQRFCKMLFDTLSRRTETLSRFQDAVIDGPGSLCKCEV